ncbi:hypothetical protein M2140_000166 [Clostridiales Family XIII bacterium PM5-7]
MSKKITNMNGLNAMTFSPQFNSAPSKSVGYDSGDTTFNPKFQTMPGNGGKVIDSYEELKNLPQINGVEIIGNKSFSDYGLEALTNMEIEALLNGADL